MTLRARLTAILAILVAIGLLIAGVVTYGALRSFLFERVDEQLMSARTIAVEELRARFLDIERLPSPDDLLIPAYAELRSPTGEIVEDAWLGVPGTEVDHRPEPPDPVIVGPGPRPLTLGATDDPSYTFRVLATPTVGGGTLIVAIPLADVQRTLRRLVLIESIVAASVLAAIGAAAWLLVRRELRPLDTMARAASDIAAGDLTRRVEEGDRRTEVGRLGTALNLMLEHIENAFGVQRASEERMRRFLADASHELRTPLTSIRGYAELFRRGAHERPEDLRLSMQRIEDEAGRMGLLVEDLLLLAHVDRTRPLEKVEVDLGAIVADAGRDAQARAPDRSITVSAPDDGIVVGDPDRLRQAVDNLVANALVHTPDGTPVGIELAGESGWMVVHVTDRGPGLDADALAHAFERFWRGDPSRSRHSGGIGLGLAIVDAIARAHGGEVVAANEDGGGARFSIRLPRPDPPG